MIVPASVGGLGAVDQFVGEVVDNQGVSQKKREKWTRNGPEMVPKLESHGPALAEICRCDLGPAFVGLRQGKTVAVRALHRGGEGFQTLLFLLS